MEPVDLPPLAQLRERWRMLAIVAHACSLPDLWTSAPDGDTHADSIGSGLELLARSPGAVLTGFDAELPDDQQFVETSLLVDGVPDWVRVAVEEVAPLGDAVWWDGTAWWRTSAASGLASAVDILTTPLTSPEGMVEELLTFVEVDQYEDREAALDFVQNPNADALIRLYGGGRRSGFEPDHAHAAFEVYTR